LTPPRLPTQWKQASSNLKSVKRTQLLSQVAISFFYLPLAVQESLPSLLMFLSLGNIEDTAQIGMLFIDFETPHRVRVQANARLSTDDPLLAGFPGAIAVIKAEVTSVFVNCARYIHKHERKATSPYVPDAKGKQPYALWKRINHMQDHLPEKDQGKAQQEGGLITEEDYRDALSRGES